MKEEEEGGKGFQAFCRSGRGYQLPESPEASDCHHKCVMSCEFAKLR